jgi:hypothetical protein
MNRKVGVDYMDAAAAIMDFTHKNTKEELQLALRYLIKHNAEDLIGILGL